MDIIGLQVTSGSPGGLAIGAVPPEKVELTYGQSLRITTSFNYRGAAVDFTLYGAIGNRGWVGFDEIISAEATYKTPESRTTFVPVTAAVDIPITAAIDAKPDYDIYCKIREHPEAGSPEVDDIITITGISPTFTLIQHTIYPSYYTYDGEVEVSTFIARISPFSPSNWAAERFAGELKNQIEAKGGQAIELKVYVDITPLLWTDIKIELTATPVGGTASAAEHLTTGLAEIVAAIILAVLIIIGILVLTSSILSIIKAFKHQALTEEIKKTWAKPTLISVISDFEAKLKLPATPPSELEGMADQELRDYCDLLAEEIAPPGVSWLPWAIGAGVGVLALGAVAVLAGRKKK